MSRTVPRVIAALVVTLVMAAPAIAHEERAGLIGLGALGGLASWVAPPTNGGQNSGTNQNMRLVANVPAAPAPDISAGTAFTKSDLAFWGDRAYAGGYAGFRIVDIADPADPQLLVDYPCPGYQNDVSVWENRLLFLSVDQPTPDPADGTPLNGACVSHYAAAVSRLDSRNFEGIRIFDVSNPRVPVFVKGVDVDCGSHTHTLVPDPSGNRLLLYVSSIVGAGGPQCPPLSPHRQISIVEVPLDDPGGARVIREPQLGTNECHDVQVFLALKLAVASCLVNGQLWDIADPDDPKTLPSQGAVYVDRDEVALWHSAVFSWDGGTVVFGDEDLNGVCSAASQAGRLWFYRRTGMELSSTGSMMIPRPQQSLCSVHQFIPIPGPAGSLVAGWYNGGADVIDFTHPDAATEAGYYNRDRELPSLGVWAAYWYNGYIYASDSHSGLDVLEYTGTLSPAPRILDHLNPQTQEEAIAP